MSGIPFTTTDWSQVAVTEHSCQVAGQAEPHRSSSPTGAKLFIVD